MQNDTHPQTKIYMRHCCFWRLVSVFLNTVLNQVLAMKSPSKFFLISAVLSACFVCSSVAQEPIQGGSQRPRRQGGQGGGDFRRGAFGEVTEISGSALKIKLPNGSVGTVNTTASTRFRKDEQEAKLSDFKVGDHIFVRGESTVETSCTATA